MKTSGSLADKAYKALEQRIVTLELAPGQVVSENTLASSLRMGRSPVRDAVKQLAREGLVAILPKRGIVVSEMDLLKQLELLEARRPVERYVVGAAAIRATQEEKDLFCELAGAMEKAGILDDGPSFLSLDKTFHEELLAAGRNRYAAAMMRIVQGQSRRFFYAYYDRTTSLPEIADLHANVARSVSKGNVRNARGAFDKLMDRVEAFTRATLDIS